jgi:aminoglycoside 6-adenylyltransferase
MRNDEDTREKLLRWAQQEKNVRAMLLVGSRAERLNEVDAFSDYDIELFVKDLDAFRNDAWLKTFGEVMILWPLKPMPTWNEHWITRLVLFKNDVRIDFQITSVTHFDPHRYDGGHVVLIDKDSITTMIPKPTRKNHLIKKPTEEEFLACVNEFFWDMTYVPKYLARQDLLGAKYMLDAVIRFNYFQRMIEWFIGMRHDWTVGTGSHGQLLKQYLDPQLWAQLESTFVGAAGTDIRKAFSTMITLFRRCAREVATKLGYTYPEKTEEEAIAYFTRVK